MFNRFEKQAVKILNNLIPLVKELNDKHDVNKVSITFTSGIFSFGNKPGINIRVTEKNAENYETHWDSLIFSILGTDTKADIIDSADIERTTNNAMRYIKNMASDLSQQRLMAKSFQTASREHYQKLTESEIADYCACLGSPGESLTPEEIQAELMKRIRAVFRTTSNGMLTHES